MAGVVSQGLKLSYSATSTGTYTALSDCLSFPRLGVKEAKFDQIEVTTTDSTAHEYIDGLGAEGDNMEFQFIYDKAQFLALKNITALTYWKVTLPGTSAPVFSFQGKCNVSIDEASPNTALTYTLTIVNPTNFAWA